MKYYKVRNQIRVRIVADEDVDLVPSHWVDVSDIQVPRSGDKPNVKFDRPKPKKEKKKQKK
tara:strand:- start:2760 stop:2942 length:183 start_codon:yes stop_codon:yes gene_type:complete